MKALGLGTQYTLSLIEMYPSLPGTTDIQPAFWLVKGLFGGAWEDLNLRLHPYQQSSTERHADRSFPW
jgi:hypothetical protein